MNPMNATRNTSRIVAGVAAFAMSLLTFAVLVVAPAHTDTDGVDAYVTAARAGDGAARNFAITPSRIVVVGTRENARTVAQAKPAVVQRDAGSSAL